MNILRSVFLIALASICAGSVSAQEYLGYSGSNYAGVHGLFTNPASIADSRYELDINVFGVSVGFNNDFLALRNDGFLGMGTLTESYDDWADFRERALIVNFDGSESGQKANLKLSADVLGPAALITLSSVDAIAVGARYRTIINFDNLGAEAARLALDEFVYPPLWGQNFESDSSSLDALAWIEYFGSYGREIWNDGEHYIKAGVTLKLLQGTAAYYMYGEDVNYNFTNDDILTIQESTVLYGHSENFDTDKLYNDVYVNLGAWGFGADIGVIYEWRPEGAAYSGRMRDNSVAKNDRSATRYKLRAGFSLMDLGGIRFDRDPKSYDRPPGSIDIDNWDLTEIQLDGVESFDDTLNNRFPVQAEGLEDKFGMNLPFAINMQVDYQLYKGFYLGANGWISPKAIKNVDKVHGISRLTINPRFEHRWFEAGFPLSYQNFNGIDAGIYLRLGPVILGSADLFSEAFSEGIDAANVYLALKIPILFDRTTNGATGDSYEQY